MSHMIAHVDREIDRCVPRNGFPFSQATPWYRNSVWDILGVAHRLQLDAIREISEQLYPSLPRSG